MRILICATDKECGEWTRDLLLEFGRGMHISVASKDFAQVLSDNWSFIIVLGDSMIGMPNGVPHCFYSLPHNDEDLAELRRNLWILYRDTLRDMIGGKCSCGMFDMCHCH